MSTNVLPPVWERVLDRLDHAFQPIVNVHSGVAYGYEALLRHQEAAGFPSIQALFDAAFDDRVLFPVELALRERALAKFQRLVPDLRGKLFLNVDNRVLEMPDYNPGLTARMLTRFGMPKSRLTLEISERHGFQAVETLQRVTRAYRSQEFSIAIDDFGRGFSGLQVLYECEPNILKIDRYFIDQIATDQRRKALVTSVVNLAHLLGITVLAEGVETERDFLVCRDLGCDLAQGYFVDRPTLEFGQLRAVYEPVAVMATMDRRRDPSRSAMAQHLQMLPAVRIDADLLEVAQQLALHPEHSFLPVIDAQDEPVGVLRERDLKALLYSAYGRELLSNATYRRTVARYVVRCPVVDLYADVKQVVDIYAADRGNEGILVVQDRSYAGFLTSSALVTLISEFNVAAARDQNPLTKLPGNNLIFEHVSRSLSEPRDAVALVYFDFDNFKPFNDTYGFRQGDRAILLFGDSLAGLAGAHCFVGHIGGDDFFAAFRGAALDLVCDRVLALIAKFTSDAESLYDAKTRARGYMSAKDRDGVDRRFALLSVSAVLLWLEPGHGMRTAEDVSAVIAKHKKAAKTAPTRLHIVRPTEAALVS